MQADFLKYQAQTGLHPLGLEVDKASGSYIYDSNGKAYLDFVAGVSACTLGHCHPKVVGAVEAQLQRYMHVMVYGEFIQDISLKYAKLLAANLPSSLQTTYLVNSGTEAMEGAIKLARRATGKSEIIAARNAYHGNTLGSLSLMDFEERKAPFRPLLPDIKFIEFNSIADLEKITQRTAAVVLETIQGGAGFILPKNDYLKKVKSKCESTGSMLILDEIQPGFGRTGKLFAFEHYGITPDILVMGKGMAGGLPVGAFSSSLEMMKTLSHQPELGHITTFGGNPVIAAAALATLEELLHSGLMETIAEKEALIREKLVHPGIIEIRGRGLMLSLILQNEKMANDLVVKAMENGLILFWLLFEKRAVRITPPLTISMSELEEGCRIILEILGGSGQ